MKIPDLSMLMLILAVITVTTAVFGIISNRRNTRRMLTTMNEMLNMAVRGNFSDKVFDESLLSAVETKLAHFLSASAISAKNVSDEKEKIKELISDISHQTKTPLANILLYSQLLSEQKLPEESDTCVRALSQQAEKLHFLIGSLVKTSRLETGILALHPGQNKIRSILDEVESQIRPLSAAKDIELFITSASETAYFDSKWTTEAIYNIVDNAVKYTQKGGKISITVIPYEIFLRIDITDTGIGIPEEEQSKIFQRFYRSPAVGDTEGIGIGLYLSRQIINGESGYIKVVSGREKGTTFSVFLLRKP